MKAALYLQTNDAAANEAIAYARSADGQLERAGAYATGGKGSGKPHLASQASVVLHEDHLLVTNAGSDDVTLFGITADGLVVLDRVPSGGSAPTSVAVHGRRVYDLRLGRRDAVRLRLRGERHARRHRGGGRGDRQGVGVVVHDRRSRADRARQRAGRQHAQRG